MVTNKEVLLNMKGKILLSSLAALLLVGSVTSSETACNAHIELSSDES